MRTVHRIISLFVVMVTLFLGVTGSLIQGVDLQTILRHAPATDPDMMAIREDKDGPDDFAVLGPSEYTAQLLPADFDYQSALGRLLQESRSAFGAEPLDYADLRMGPLGPVGETKSGKRLLHFE